MKTLLRLLFLTVSVFVFSAMTNIAIGQATVTTDKPDYAPRSNAVFTGAGFQPGEQVQLRVKNLFRPCNTVTSDSSYLPWTVTADPSGGFVTNWTVCDCDGDSLRLKATGQSSGLVAYAFFADANKTFTAGSGSGADIFSNASKWNGNTLPAAGDNITIRGACTFDNAASNLAYGTLSFGGGGNPGSVVWPIGGTNTLNVTDISASISGSAIDMTNGGTLNVKGIWTSTNITFTSGNGTVIFNNTGANVTMPSAYSTYNNLTINATGRAVSLGVATTLNGNLVITAGTFSVSASNFNLTVKGNWTNSGTFTAGTGTVTFNGPSGTQLLNSGGSSFNNISHNAAGTLQLTTNALTTTGTFTNSSGTFDANGLGHTVTGLSTISGGNYLASTATQTFNGGLTITGTGTFTGSTGGVNTTNVTFPVGNNGTLIAPSGTFNVSGDWSKGSGTFNPGTYTVTFTNTGTMQVNAGGTPFYNFIHSGSGLLQLQTTLPVNGTFTNSGGNFSAQNQAVVVAKLATISSGTYTCPGTNSGFSQTFNGGLTISGGTFDGTAAPVFVTDLTLSSGTLVASGNAPLSVGDGFNVSGFWLKNGGTFTPGADVLVFNGSSAQSIGGTNITTFGDLEIANTSGGILLNQDVTINGALTLTSGIIDGATNNKIVTIGSAGTASAGSTTSYISGKLARIFAAAASKNYPIGKGGNFRPATVNLTAITGVPTTITGEQIEGGSYGGTTPANTTVFTNRYWTFTSSGGSGHVYDITLDGTGFTPGTSAQPVILKYNGSTTSSFNATQSANNYTASGINGFSNFALASQCDPPTITSPNQPQNQTVCAGQSASFNVTATGQGSPSYTYQWHKENGATDIQLSNGGNISGATTNTLTINPVGTSDAGMYYVIVSRPCGTSTTSSNATLTVNIAPVFTTCPSNIIQGTDADVCAAVVSYTATASGSPSPTYTYSFTGTNPPSPSSGSGTGSGATFNKGTTTVTITAHNVCSPDAVCTFTVTINDTQAPKLTGTPYAGTSTINACKANASTAAPFSATNAVQGYTDNCGGTVTATLTNTSVTGTDCAWTVTYTFSVKDVNNNTLSNQSYSNTGSDKTAPTGTNPTAITGVNSCLPTQSQADADFNATLAAAGYSDNCGGDVTATFVSAVVSGDKCAWTVTYTFTVKDECNNATANQTYTRSGGDKTAPTGTNPTAITGVNSCLPTQSQADADFNATLAASGYSDNCGGDVTATFVSAVVSGNKCAWTVTYTFTVKDECNNATANQTYTRSGGDKTAPTGTNPTAITGVNSCKPTQSEADAAFNATLAAAGYSDNCGGDVTATFVSAVVSGDKCAWTVTYTFTVKDECNNATGNQTYTRSGGDKTAPTGTNPTAITGVNSCLPTQSQADADFNATLAASGYSDNCGGDVNATFVSAVVSGNKCAWTVTYTFTVKDECNNATGNQTYTRSGGDKTAPTGTNPTAITGVNSCLPTQSQADADFNATLAASGYSDNCGGDVNATFVSAVVSGNKCAWTVTYTFTVKDECNNATANQTYTRSGGDKTAPTGTNPTAITGVNSCLPTQSQADADFNATLAASGYSDNCGGDVNATFVNAVVSGDKCAWTVTYTFTVKDECNNATANQTYTRSGGDKTAPTGTNPSAITGVNSCLPTQSQADADFNATLAASGYSDNCGGDVNATFVNAVVSGDKCAWTVTYTFTVKDECNNATANQTYTRSGGDKTAPTGTNPSAITGVNSCLPTQSQADADFNATLAAAGYSDNCGGDVTATFVSAVVSGDKCAWTVTYTFTVKDECNNATANQTYTRSGGDKTAPTGTNPTAITGVNSCLPTQSQADADFNATLAASGYSDNCGGDVTATFISAVVSGDKCAWTVTYTFTVKDECNNATGNQTYTRSGGDKTAPTGTNPTAITGVNSCKPTQSEADAAFNATLAAAGYSDNCGGDVTATFVSAVVSGNKCAWTVTYTFTVKDECNNATGNQTYTRSGGDKTAPTGTNPTAITGVNSCLPIQSQADADFNATLAASGYSDNCGGDVTATFVSAVVSGDKCAWTVTYTFTVKDECNNATGNQTYTRSGGDKTAPTGTNPTAITGVNSCLPTQSQADADFNATLAASGYSDNCGGDVTATFVSAVISGNKCAWTVTYTFTVKDECNNATGNQTYTRSGGDKTAPTLTGTPYAGTTGTNACKTNAATAAPFSSTNAIQGYSDNCGGAVTATLTGTNVTGTDCAWAVTYTFDIKDACGNTFANRSYTNTGSDQTAPIITICPGNKTAVPNNAGCSFKQTTNTWDATATDNCNTPVIKYTLSGATTSAAGAYTTLNGVVFNSGVTNVSATATDGCSNVSAACNFTVTVTSTLTASCSNNNAVLYYGYTGDQTSTITVKPSGGTGSYNVTITMSRPLICNSVNTTGDEVISASGYTSASNLSCPTSGTGTPGNPTIIVNNVSASTGYSFNVTLMDNATFAATFTDALGCQTSCTTYIHADDVRCFAGNSGNAKVTMCHQTGSKSNPCVKICVDNDAVNEHLAHGDYFGPCTPDCKPPVTNTGAVRNPDQAAVDITNPNAITNESSTGLRVKVSPNPSTTYFTLGLTSAKPEKIQMKVVDIMGRVLEIKSGILPNGNIQVGSNLRPGTYIAEFMQGKQKVAVKLFKIYR